ncbi:enoyl-CoA hydratase-related protein [Nocardioides ochotonae]|uniref:enoyl-CoA hydratase-related protein n=1 Tax=Nocardioides ochotonae TaxID=2685869 RepID=UPI001407CBB6|nr:enoyl-CoA hydratase-related protein [Nocardioides ochotonae]
MGVITELSGHTLLVTIDRPEARNAIDQDTWDALGDAWRRAETDPDVRAVVVTGTGDRAFSAGADLRAIAEGGYRTEPDPVRDPWGFAGVTSHDISVPVVAAVNGLALGGGWEIVLACDLVVAAEHAEFALPEVQRGLVAGGGGAFRIAEQLPRPLAMQLLLTGERISATRARDLGLVNQVVAAERLLPEALALAERIARNAPLAVQATKRIARSITRGTAVADTEHWMRSGTEVTRVMRSEDAREGARAFVENREPVWRAR